EKEDSKRQFPLKYPFDYLKRQYYLAVEKAGGIPILLPNLRDRNLLDHMLKLVNGLLISGGYDVHPGYYKDNKLHPSTKLTPDRDRFEIAIVKKARAKKLPVLGICRGHQIINVAFGGTLYQDWTLRKQTNDHRAGKNFYNKKRHKVVIKEDTKLYSIISKKEIMVNTSHHQIIKDAAPGFVISALSKDGVVEGLESKKDKYLISIQWHPEVDYQEENSKKLFISLIEAAKEK
ncbi:MAG: gamma-glutamyl-gamma-aminobutyrate hydrolase family protein, partial [candidate division Zixibacteria bacterium]|nr:gamma-glutamyl-gamma-aminobutyrate hydrolase family protein [candidate division Zixibacteria bacterium]